MPSSPTAAYCFDPEGNEVYLMDSGGCYWDDNVDARTSKSTMKVSLTT